MESLLSLYFQNGTIGWIGLVATIAIVYIALRILAYLMMIVGIIITVIGVSGIAISFFLESAPFDWKEPAVLLVLGSAISTFAKIFSASSDGDDSVD